jgi:hypothetical protein
MLPSRERYDQQEIKGRCGNFFKKYNCVEDRTIGTRSILSRGDRI